MASRQPRRGFSSLQMIVLLAVLLFLLAFALPIIQRIRAAAVRSESENNLRQLTLAMHSYHDAFKKLPAAVSATGSAHFDLLPFVEEGPLYTSADGASWKNGAYGKVVQVFLDPRDPSLPDHVYKNWLATTNYPVNWMVAKDGKTRLNAIPDGTSNTLMFAQRYQICSGAPTAWGYPAIHTWAPMFAYYSEAKFQSAPSQERCDPTLAQSIGPGMLIAFCDGSTRQLSESISPTTWHYLCDPSDGNAIPQEAFDN